MCEWANKIIESSPLWDMVKCISCSHASVYTLLCLVTASSLSNRFFIANLSPVAVTFADD